MGADKGLGSHGRDPMGAGIPMSILKLISDGIAAMRAKEAE
jgi:hypothetical protein